MISYIDKKKDRKFLVAQLIKIDQKDKSFYLAKLKAKDLVKTFTVTPLQYDVEKFKSLATKYPDEEEYYQDLISRKKEIFKPYQKSFRGKRVLNVSKI